VKRQKIILLSITVCTLILEILPYGAVCVFLSDGGEKTRKLFSYFDLVPFGYANFAPFITALLTCALLVLGVIHLVKTSRALQRTICAVSGIAFLVSLAPMLYGISFFSVVAAIISLLLLIEFLVSLCAFRN